MSQVPPPIVGYASPQTYSNAFIPSQERAKLATVFLWIAVGFSILLTMGRIALVTLFDVDAIFNSPNAPPAGVIALVGILGLLVFGRFVGLILTVIFYLRWQYQAQQNLFALGRPTPITPGWGVGWWFIPIMNLFRPYENLKAVTMESTPELRIFGLLGAYWASLIFWGVSSRVSKWLGKADQISISVALEVVALVLEVAAAVLLVKMMQYVIRGQSQLLTQASTVRTYR